MPKAILIYEHGGPEVMRWEDVEVGKPARGEVLVRHTAIGLNFVDVYDRTGLYPSKVPGGLGREAAGVVVAVGGGVRGLRPGHRVAYTYPIPGAYAELRVCPADRLVRVPSGISDEQAAAMMLKGLTAHALVRRAHPVKRGETVVVHAAAGGVGLILVQWARKLGARVIGVVSSEQKARLAKAHGCHHIVFSNEDLPVAVRKLSGGQGADVVYDGVGKDTFQASLDSLRRLGMMVTYGNASGPVPPFSPLELTRRGSLFLTRPTLFDYIADRKQLEKAASELFGLVRRRAVRILIGQSYPLRDVATAHRDLEGRKTTGSTILIP